MQGAMKGEAHDPQVVAKKVNANTGRRACKIYLNLKEELLSFFQRETALHSLLGGLTMDEKKVIETTLTEYENEQLKLLKSVFDMGCAFKMLALQKEARDWELKYLTEKKEFEYAQEQIERILIEEDLLKKELAKKERDTAKKFADLVEFHSIARMNDGVEYFTISALGLKEILVEEFGFKYSELNGVEVE